MRGNQKKILCLEEFEHLPLNFVEQSMLVYKKSIGKEENEPMLLATEDYVSMLNQMYAGRESIQINYDEFKERDRETSLGFAVLDWTGDAEDFINLEEKMKERLDAMFYQTEKSTILERMDITSTRTNRFFPAHWHSSSFFDVYYVYKGSPLVHFQEYDVTLREGDVMLLAPEVLHGEELCHREDIMQSTAIRKTTFQETFLKTVAENQFLKNFFSKALNGKSGNQYLIFHTGEDQEIKDLFYRLLLENHTGEMYQNSMMNAYMSLIFAILLRKHDDHMIVPEDSVFPWQPQYARIFNYMEQHFATVTVADLAEQFNYSTRHIMRIVENCTGEKFSVIIRKYRLARAYQLLKNPQNSVTQTAEAVGYEDATSFSRAFKKEYGISPSEVPG